MRREGRREEKREGNLGSLDQKQPVTVDERGISFRRFRRELFPDSGRDNCPYPPTLLSSAGGGIS